VRKFYGLRQIYYTRHRRKLRLLGLPLSKRYWPNKWLRTRLKPRLRQQKGTHLCPSSGIDGKVDLKMI